MRNSRASFTLIELLIVIAIVAVLSVVVVLALNPAQLLKQARDSNRLSDIDTLNRAITLYRTDTGGSLGAASTTYFSLVDPTATSTVGTNCAGVGIAIATTTGWNYHCPASSTVSSVDGTGWLPINFRLISYGSPLGSLPKDPVNTSNSGLYYMYTPSATDYSLALMTESTKYTTLGLNDGGVDPGRYELGSNILLGGYGEGLLGWWKLDEGSGTNAASSFGIANTGTLTNGPAWVGGKLGGAVSLDGADDYVSIPNQMFSGTFHGPSTLILWLNATSLPGATTRHVFSDNCNEWGINHSATTLRGEAYHTPTGMTIVTGTWYQAAIVHEHPTGLTNTKVDFYVNGDLKGETTWTLTSENGYNDTPYYIGSDPCNGVATSSFNGLVDDVRIYGRALSSAEIAAIYNAQK